MLSTLFITAKLGIVLAAGTWLFALLINRQDAEWVKRKPFGILVGLYAIGMLCHNVWIAYAAMVAAVPMTTKSRGEGAGLFIVALGAMPDLTTGLRIGGASILGIDKFVCMSLGLAWVLLSRPRLGLRTAGRVDVPFLIMLALEFVGARDMNFTSAFRSLLTTALALGLPYFALVNSVGRVEDLRRVMISLTYVGFILAVAGIWEAITHVLYYQLMSGPLGVPGIPYYLMLKFRGGLLRPVTSFGETTTYAQFLTIALTATIACRPSFRSTSKMVVALAVISLGIFVTSTRNAWIGAILCVLGFDLFRKRYLAVAGKMTVLGMGYAIMLLLAEFVPYVATMMGKSNDTAGTADYRSQLLTRGIEEFHKHPWFGYNMGAVIANMQDMVQGEGIVDFVNGYLFYSLSAGVFGLVGLALLFLLPCWMMLRTRRAMMAQGLFMQRTAAFAFAVPFSFLITTAFTGFGGKSSTYFYMTVGIAAILYSWRNVSPALIAASDRPFPGSKAPPSDPVEAEPAKPRRRRRRAGQAAAS